MALVFWLVLGVVLLVVELTHFAFFALFGALGAFAAALVAAGAARRPSRSRCSWPWPCAARHLGRPSARARGAPQPHRLPPARGVHGSLVGEEVLTLDVVGDARHPGHVRLAGERWLATSGVGTAHPGRHQRVLVTAVEGTTLVVWPVEGSRGYVDIEASTPPPAARRSRRRAVVIADISTVMHRRPGRPGTDRGRAAVGPAPGVNIVQQGQVGVVKRLGEYRKTHEPGLVIILPFVDTLQTRRHARDPRARRPPGRDHQGQRRGHRQRHDLHPGRRRQAGAVQRRRTSTSPSTPWPAPRCGRSSAR